MRNYILNGTFKKRRERKTREKPNPLAMDPYMSIMPHTFLLFGQNNRVKSVAFYHHSQLALRSSEFGEQHLPLRRLHFNFEYFIAGTTKWISKRLKITSIQTIESILFTLSFTCFECLNVQNGLFLSHTIKGDFFLLYSRLRTHYPSHFNKAITHLNHENGIVVVSIALK